MKLLVMLYLWTMFIVGNFTIGYLLGQVTHRLVDWVAKKVKNRL